MNKCLAIIFAALILASCSDDPVYWVCDEVDKDIKIMMSEDFKTCLLKSSVSDCRYQLAQLYCKPVRYSAIPKGTSPEEVFTEPEELPK